MLSLRMNEFLLRCDNLVLSIEKHATAPYFDVQSWCDGAWHQLQSAVKPVVLAARKSPLAAIAAMLQWLHAVVDRLELMKRLTENNREALIFICDYQQAAARVFALHLCAQLLSSRPGRPEGVPAILEMLQALAAATINEAVKSAKRRSLFADPLSLLVAVWFRLDPADMTEFVRTSLQDPRLKPGKHAVLVLGLCRITLEVCVGRPSLFVDLSAGQA